MIRSLDVFIDQASWPITGSPAFPPSFTPGASSYDVPILPTLLLIGQLTTPPLARGVSLSEFWAWIRYVYAISSDSDLRISTDFASLDSHQKTILSDDFGMGIPVGYLIGKLDFVGWSDGRYFMDRMSAIMSGPLPTPRKRGPRKAPDFIFLDNGGKLHVVECKGGQSGATARNRQLSHTTKNGVSSGGVVQKRMVLLPANLQGQRLACGLSLGTSGKPDASNLKILDPELQVEFDVSKTEQGLLQDPIARSGLAKWLRGAGFEVSAAAIAAPSGPTARDQPSEKISRFARQRRIDFINQRNTAARAELTSSEMTTFQVGGIKHTGREVMMVLPIPLSIDGKVYRRAIIRQGITFDLIGEVLDRGLTEGPLPDVFGANGKHGKIALMGDGPRAELGIAESFVSEIILEKSAGIPITSA